MPAKRLRTETHCAHGHPWVENLYVNPYDGSQHCRACRRDAAHRWYVLNGVRRGEYTPRRNGGANGAR